MPSVSTTALQHWLQDDAVGLHQAVADYARVYNHRPHIEPDGAVWDGWCWWSEHTQDRFVHWANEQGYVYGGRFTQYPQRKD